MKQYKHLGGDEFLKSFTEMYNDDMHCIYCGDSANSREHIPSKVFLQEPYPNHLSVIPSCKKCNNGFSSNEAYTACFLNYLQNKIYPNIEIKDKVKQMLDYKPEILEEIKQQIKQIDNKINFSFDIEKLESILAKLAIGHAGFEMDFFDLDKKPNLIYKFIFDMTEEIEHFCTLRKIDTIPEAGCRLCNKIWYGADSDDILCTFVVPEIVQENNYRYIAYYDNDTPIVEFVINEFLFCKAYWD